MDINYYKNFNMDLIRFSNNALIKHYNNYGKNENRIYNETVFYEKYPDFDLYNVIAEQCHQAVPSQQVDKKPFSHFKVATSDVPEGQKVYSLFF